MTRNCTCRWDACAVRKYVVLVDFTVFCIPLPVWQAKMVDYLHCRSFTYAVKENFITISVICLFTVLLVCFVSQGTLVPLCCFLSYHFVVACNVAPDSSTRLRTL